MIWFLLIGVVGFVLLVEGIRQSILAWKERQRNRLRTADGFIPKVWSPDLSDAFEDHVILSALLEQRRQRAQGDVIHISDRSNKRIENG